MSRPSAEITPEDGAHGPPPAIEKFPARGGSIRVWLLLLLVVYATGLCRDISEPWVGLHDWNGAFFSQLARNLLRYPASLHHGMPIVAVGALPPALDEYSIYATHPPALVWLVAGSFRLLGESELTARLVPILASLASLGLLVWLLNRAYGRNVALLAGAIHAVMPMSVYFGRMVNHEAICLFCMVGAVAAWSVVSHPASPRRARRGAAAGWVAVMILGIWVDWPMLLFASLFCLYLAYEARGRRMRPHVVIAAMGVVALAASGMVVFLVYAGLDGRWEDLGAIFLSRTASGDDGGSRLATSSQGPGAFTVANLSPFILAFALLGLVRGVARVVSRRGVPDLDPHDAAGDRCRVARTGLILVAVTGLIWLFVFWRQYELHHYWMFYLGPAVAVLAAKALILLQQRLDAWSRPLARPCLACLLIVTGVFAFRGTDAYFDAVYPGLLDAVQGWKAIRAQTVPGDRLLLHRSPVHEELRGGYRFRNIVPPQWAYYLDRGFDVESDMGRVPLAGETHALFILPLADAVLESGSLKALRASYPEELLGASVVFRLRPSPAASGPPPATDRNP